MKKKIVVLTFALIFACMPVPGQTRLLSRFHFENNLTDSLGYTGTMNGDVVTFVSGYRGMAARSSHNNDDGGDDFEIGFTRWPSTREVCIHYYLKLEPGYLASDPDIVNFKQFWTLSNDYHHGIQIQDVDPTSLGFAWQISGGAGWDGGSKVTKYGNISYICGDWLELMIYVKLSTGNGLNADGICQLRANGRTIIQGTNVVTGIPGNFRSPCMKATGDCASGHGWWQLDEYEIWDGMTGTSGILTVPMLESRDMLVTGTSEIQRVVIYNLIGRTIQIGKDWSNRSVQPGIFIIKPAGSQKAQYKRVILSK